MDLKVNSVGNFELLMLGTGRCWSVVDVGLDREWNWMREAQISMVAGLVHLGESIEDEKVVFRLMELMIGQALIVSWTNGVIPMRYFW